MTRTPFGLGDLDPRTVPLPHGTDVTTRVDLLREERLIPQGTLGRVVGGDGVTVELRLVSGELLSCRREDVLARKVGQVRYARARAARWEALLPGVILETTVGSLAWGLADAGSDHDRRGIFVLPFAWSAGLVEPPRDLVSEDGSATYWEVKKAFQQALRADPNTLETLFVPGAAAHDDLGAWILAERELFVSAQIYGSFGRYALSQLKKLEQSQRLAEHRGVVLSWLRAEPDLTLDLTATRLAAATGAGHSNDAVHRHKEYLKQLCRSLHDQGLITDRAFPALAVFAQQPTALELPRELRPKNAYNLLRLLHTAIGWLRDGQPTFVLPEPIRSRLLTIKKGQVALVEVLAEAEATVPILEEAWRGTRLPRAPDWAGADRLLRRIQTEVARRAWSDPTGYFGPKGPPPPVPEEEDAHE